MSPENTNSVLVSKGDMCVIFDPWGRADDWDNLLRRRGLHLHAIYATHGHPDHIACAAELAGRHGCKWYMRAADNALIGWGNDLLAYYGLPPIDGTGVPPADLPYDVTEILPGVTAQITACPGHTPGGVAYFLPDMETLIVGDTIFANGIGRYDLPGGDGRTLMQTIARLHELNLPDTTRVIHGHGPASTIGELKRNNPYF